MTTITDQLAEALRAILECSKSDAWNGSMKLDDALKDTREALAAYDAQRSSPVVMPELPGCDAQSMSNYGIHDDLYEPDTVERIQREAFDAGRMFPWSD